MHDNSLWEKCGIKNVAGVVWESCKSKPWLGTVGQEQKITHCRNISKILYNNLRSKGKIDTLNIYTWPHIYTIH